MWSALFLGLASATNLNGIYQIGNSQTFETDFAKKGSEYFDVYTQNITSRYGEVYWTQMPDVTLPPEIVARFANSTIAITGYETDQMMLLPNGTEAPLSINWVYNHHYVFSLLGAKAQMKLVKAESNEMDFWMRRDGMKWMAVDTEPNPEGIPNSAFFAEGNGGEMRKSFHGYPQNMAQLVASPQRFSIAPMQIDTHNRDNNSTKFVVGPLPKAATRGPANPPYSPLLECPCTDRIYKKINHIYTSHVQNTCPSLEGISNSTDCFAAVSALLKTATATKTISDLTQPSGCFFSNNGGVTAYFNEASSNTSCGQGLRVSGATAEPTTGVVLNLTVDAVNDLATITLQGPADAWFGCGFNAAIMANTPYAIIVHNASGGTAAIMERKLGDHDPGTELAPSVKLVSQSVSGNVRTVVLTRALKGKTFDYYTFDLSLDSTIPIIAAVGSSQAFAYHKLRGGISLTLVNPSGTTCVCDQGENGQLCNQMGCVEWSLTGGQSVVGPRCPPAPLSQLAEQDNPTCRLSTYVGGLTCCAHLNLLLDQSQSAWPDNMLTYRIKVRFWFQEYKPATPKAALASHTDLIRLYWQTEALAGEYDVPEGSSSGLSPPAMVKEPDGSYVHTLVSYFTVQQMIWNCNPVTDPNHCMPTGTKGIELVVAAGHCHAPACLSLELYNNDTQPPTLICRQLPVYGTGDVHDRFDEKGYAALPPCLWGESAEGLLPRPQLPYSTMLISVKKNNATYYHYGEMASWQMRGILF
jgi:hypothetical protein